jgi:hypothetical protein
MVAVSPRLDSGTRVRVARGARTPSYCSPYRVSYGSLNPRNTSRLQMRT